MAFLLGEPAHADEPVAARAVEKPLAQGVHADLSLGVIGAGYERVFADHLSIQLSAHYYRPWYSDPSAWGLGAELRPYFFLLPEAPAGPYVSPFLRLEYLVGPSGGAGLSGGVTLGYSLVLRRALALRLGAGIQYQSFHLSPPTTSAPASAQSNAGAVNVNGVIPAVDISIGYVW